ncbi:ankyrin repeat-containing domain protein [Xylariaceae sp. FL0255]|nr:ankyrin repeat-containing domain protein [Xylariaceae sp. FL0255]
MDNSTSERDNLRLDTVWEDAYDQFERDNAKLVKFYQDSILAEARTKCHDGRRDILDRDTSSTEGFQKQFLVVLNIQYEYIKERQWKIKIKNKTIVVNEIIQKTTRAIQKAKDVVTLIASNEPHASIAWAAVSCLLPLILDASSQEEDALSGLDYIRDLLERYALIQRILTERMKTSTPNEESMRVQAKLRSKMVEVYVETLKFEFLMMKHFSRGKTSRMFHSVGRQLAASDDWKSMLSDLKDADGRVQEQMKTLESEVQTEIHSEVQKQSDQLADILKNSEASNKELKRRALDEWVDRMIPTDMNAIHDKLRSQICHENSGKWFVDQTKSWLEADDGKMIYWRRGSPGMGKSLLMSSAISDIGQCCSELGYDGLAFVYFQWDKQIDQINKTVSASLLRQLYPYSKSITSALETLKESNYTDPSFDQLKEILANYGQENESDKQAETNTISGKSTYARFLIFIDALDEASPETRESIKHWIGTLDSRYFRVLITSRADLTISTEDADEKIQVSELRADDKDLIAYIKARLKLSGSAPLLQDKEKFLDELAISICERAQNMFLHAKHHTLLVGKAATPDEMMEAAKKPFRSLHEIYDDLLKDLKLDSHLGSPGIKALAWLTFAKSRMNRQTFLDALALSPGDKVFKEGRRPRLDVILAHCRGLVEWDEDTNSVRLSHKTAQEYLQSQDSIIALREMIVATCFTCLTLQDANLNNEYANLDSDDTSDSGSDDSDNEETSSHRHRKNLIGSGDGVPEFTLSSTGTITFGEVGDDSKGKPKSSSLQRKSTLLKDPEINPVKIKERMEDRKYCHDYLPDVLNKWSWSTGHLAKYSGSFAIAHLLEIVKPNEVPSDLILKSVRRFLTKQPQKGLWKRLMEGENEYPRKCTPLHVVTWLQNTTLLDVVFNKHPDLDINVQDTGGETPLIYAAKSGNVGVIRKLLKLGADPSISNMIGRTAIELLTFDPPEGILTQLIPKDHNLPDTVLVQPSKIGLLNVVKVLLNAQKGDVNASLRNNRTALVLAAIEGHAEIAELLLDHGANVNVVTTKGKTPLHFAATSSASGPRKACVRLLLNRGADPNLQDEEGRNALVAAIVDTPKSAGETQLFKIAKLLIEAHVDLSSKGKGCGTALWEAQRFPLVLKLLVDSGADIHQELFGGWTANMYALVHEFSVESRTFLTLYNAERQFAKDHGIKFNAAWQNSEGNSTLHLCAAGSNSMGVEIMLKLPGGEAAVNQRNNAGQTPLFHAIHLRGAQMVKRLIDAGAETDLTDYRGNSVLDTALSVAYRDIIRMIIDKPCGISAPWDVDGVEITQFAQEPWYEKLRALIVNRSIPTLPEYGFHVSSKLEKPIITKASQRIIDQQICPVKLPSHPRMRVRRVSFKIRSHDQGYSWKQDELGGTYLFAWSWFRAGLIRAEDLNHLKTPGRGRFKNTRHVRRNVHASRDYRTYHVTWDRDSGDPSDAEWMDPLQPEDGIIVRAACSSDGWENHVESLTIDVWGDFEGGDGGGGGEMKFGKGSGSKAIGHAAGSSF